MRAGVIVGIGLLSFLISATTSAEQKNADGIEPGVQTQIEKSLAGVSPQEIAAFIAGTTKMAAIKAQDCQYALQVSKDEKPCTDFILYMNGPSVVKARVAQQYLTEHFPNAEIPEDVVREQQREMFRINETMSMINGQ